MSLKRVCLGGMVVGIIGLGVARGQSTNLPSSGPTPTNQSGVTAPLPGSIIVDGPQPPNVPFYDGPRSLEATPTAPTQNAEVGRTTLSSWMLYPRSPGCCGPTDRFGPITSELFLDIGPSFDVSGGIFGHELGVGWAIEGGARTLFYNPQCDRDCFVSFAVTNINNHARDQTIVVPFNPGTGTVGVTVRSLNRTYASVGGGYEWYLWGSANVKGINEGVLPNWRVGIEGGGRYGSAKVELNEITNRTDAIGGLYTAIYSNFEIPWHCCILTAGLRVEYGYTWCDILGQQNRTDIQDLDLLVTCGIRF